jgi:hypothetical protein
MRTFKQFLFILVAVMGLTLGVSAQKGGGQQKPPKDKPPKIEPKPKDNPPPKGGRPNRPGMAFVDFKVENFNSD